MRMGRAALTPFLCPRVPVLPSVENHLATGLVEPWAFAQARPVGKRLRLNMEEDCGLFSAEGSDVLVGYLGVGAEVTFHGLPFHGLAEKLRGVTVRPRDCSLCTCPACPPPTCRVVIY